MWLAHELDVLTAICTPIKMGGGVHCSKGKKKTKQNWNAGTKKLYNVYFRKQN